MEILEVSASTTIRSQRGINPSQSRSLCSGAARIPIDAIAPIIPHQQPAYEYYDFGESFGVMEQMTHASLQQSRREQSRKMIWLSLEDAENRQDSNAGVNFISRTLPQLVLIFVVLYTGGCKRNPPTVAVIPRTCGTALWEPEHAGAASVARSVGLNLYWNAPMRDDDTQTQISLIEKSVERGMAGIIVSPIQTLPMRTPIRRVLARGLPVVVIDTKLGIPSGPRLAYVLNDERVGGQIAARRIGMILGGKGKIAIVGIQPELSSNTVRERSLESTLASEFPQIHIVARKLGLSSVPQEQHSAEELLAGSQSPDAIVALTLAATRGTYYALAEFGKARTIKLVGFDQDLIPPIRDGGIDSVVVQNTFELGRIAMQIMDRELHGTSGPTEVNVQPVLMTSENVDSAEMREIENMLWWSPQ